MAAELKTPLDERTQTPLPIAPLFELGKFTSENSDEHHGWHPRTAAELQTVGGIALRNSWIQQTHKDAHNRGPSSYHRYFYGPELPSETYDILGRVIISCAGYVPDQVIDMTMPGGPGVRNATRDEANFLREQSSDSRFGYKRIRYGYDPVRDFFQEVALEQDLTHVDNSVLDEFLHTTTLHRRDKLAQHLLWVISEQATEKIAPRYKDLSKNQLVHPAMPKSPKPLFKWKIGSYKKIRKDFLPRLEAKLLT